MVDAPPRILMTERFDADAVERVRQIGEIVELFNGDSARLRAAVADCDALLVRTYTTVDRNVIEAARRLRVIGRAGVGLESIDLDAAKDRNIQVVYTPDASTDAVADLTIGLMIGLLRFVQIGDRFVREGRFLEGRNYKLGRELSDLTLGILGLGRIGRAVARRATNGFGMRVIYHDIIVPGLLDFVATPVDRPTLLSEADILSICVPLSFETRNLFNAEAFERMKRDALLINTARGGIVNSHDLASALTSGRLAGAALDVFDPEPLPPGHPLLTAPNTLLTPHVGARTIRAQARMNAVVDDVIRVLQGTRPQFPAWT